MTDMLPIALPSTPPAALRRSANLSDDGLYRYSLDRWWGDGAYAVFVMLNPSTADADVDDPTIRRCIGFARTWGLTGIKVVNLYALRSTNPAGLWTVDDPIGPENDAVLRTTASVASIRAWPVVAAWGANAEPARARLVADLFADRGAPLQALGVTNAGAPKHPLARGKSFIPYDTPLTRWEPTDG